MGSTDLLCFLSFSSWTIPSGFHWFVYYFGSAITCDSSHFVVCASRVKSIATSLPGLDILRTVRQDEKISSPDSRGVVATFFPLLVLWRYLFVLWSTSWIIERRYILEQISVRLRQELLVFLKVWNTFSTTNKVFFKGLFDCLFRLFIHDVGASQRLHNWRWDFSHWNDSKSHIGRRGNSDVEQMSSTTKQSFQWPTFNTSKASASSLGFWYLLVEAPSTPRYAKFSVYHWPILVLTPYSQTQHPEWCGISECGDNHSRQFCSFYTPRSPI